MHMTLPEDDRYDDDPDVCARDVYARAYHLRDDLKAVGPSEWSIRSSDALLRGSVENEILGELRAEVRLLRASEVARQLQRERRLDALLRTLDRILAPISARHEPPLGWRLAGRRAGSAQIVLNLYRDVSYGAAPDLRELHVAFSNDPGRFGVTLIVRNLGSARWAQNRPNGQDARVRHAVAWQEGSPTGGRWSIQQTKKRSLSSSKRS
jgi:hypothetical protein